MSFSLTIATSETMEKLGERLGQQLQAGDVVVLSGPLGAGKTTLTRGIGAGLGVRGPVTSPTFVVARTHPNMKGGPQLVHVDAYRLGSAVELDDLDIDFEHSVVVVEWGEGMVEKVSESRLEVAIERPVGGQDGEGEDGEDGEDDEDGEDGVQDQAGTEDHEDGSEIRRVHVTMLGPRWVDNRLVR